MINIMKCGCRATGSHNGKPVCIVHFGLKPEAEIVDNDLSLDKVLEDRIAKCPYCHTQTKSNRGLPFFEYRSNKTNDSYYCGCRGWE